MEKRYVATAVGLLSTGLFASYMLSDKDKRNQFKIKFSDYKRGILRGKKDEHYSVLKEAGIPDQLERFDLAQLGNAKMVSEGSQYGVNYYNTVQVEGSSKVED